MILVTGDPDLMGCSGKAPYHKPPVVTAELGWVADIAGHRRQYLTSRTIPQCQKEHKSEQERARLFAMVKRLKPRIKASRLDGETVLATNTPGAAAILAWSLELKKDAKFPMNKFVPRKGQQNNTPRLTFALTDFADEYSQRIVRRLVNTKGVVIHVSPSKSSLKPMGISSVPKYEHEPLQWLALKDEDYVGAKREVETDREAKLTEELALEWVPEAHEHLAKVRDGAVSAYLSFQALARLKGKSYAKDLNQLVAEGYAESVIKWGKAISPAPRVLRELPRMKQAWPFEPHHRCLACFRYWLDADAADIVESCPKCRRDTVAA